MTVSPLQNSLAGVRSVGAALQPGRGGFLHLMTPSKPGGAAGTAEADMDISSASGPDILSALAEELADLQDTVASEITGMPDLSPAGLERFELALVDTITDRLAAFDARHGTSTLQTLGDGLAMRSFAPTGVGHSPLETLDAAISRIAAELGIDLPVKRAAAAGLPMDADAPTAPAAQSQAAAAPDRITEDRAPGEATQRRLVGGTDPSAVRARSEPSTEAGQPQTSEKSAGPGPLAALSAAAADRTLPAAAAPTPAALAPPADPVAATGVLLPAASSPAPSASAAMPTLPPQVPPAEPPVLDQVRRAGITAGRTRIELAPEGLGALEIDLSADEAGQLRVVVRAENSAVLSMLRQDRAGLASALGESGINLGDAGLDFESFADERRDRDKRDETAPAPTVTPDAPLGTPEIARHPYRPRAAPGRLDILT